MAIESLAVTESPKAQSYKDEVPYSLTTTPWGSTPTSVTITVYDITDGKERDVTTTVMPTNSPSVAGDVITASVLKLLTPGHIYRMYFKFTTSGKVFAPFLIVHCSET